MNFFKVVLLIVFIPVLIFTGCNSPQSKPIDNTLSSDAPNMSSDTNNVANISSSIDDKNDDNSSLDDNENNSEPDIINDDVADDSNIIITDDVTDPDNDSDGDTPVLAPSTESNPEIAKSEPFAPNEPPAEKNDPTDNKKESWWFKRNDTNTPPTAQDVMNLAAYDAYYLGDTTSKTIYLTFDNGYENGNTPKILDILKENDVKATFFVVGTYIKSEPELTKRMAEEGHEVGNHSINHPSFPDISDEKIKEEIEGTADLFKELTGFEMPKYFRPPSGEYSQRTLQTTKNLGYKTIFWSAAFLDWDVNNQPGADYSHKMVMDNLHNGCVLLLHSVSDSNTEALDRIIKDVKAQGYEFKSLSSYF